MTTAQRLDPIRNFKFKVNIEPKGAALGSLLGGENDMGFAVVSGLTVQNEMISYREGGMNTHPHKLVGLSDYGPVTFSRGTFGNASALYDWQTFLHAWAQGAAGEGVATSSDNDYRCTITVRVFDHPVGSQEGRQYDTIGQGGVNTPPGNVKLAYRLFECWPASFSLGDLNAGESSILIQQMVVNHEGFAIMYPDETGIVNDSVLAQLS